MLEAVAAEVEYFDGLDDALETAESRIIAATMERQSESALSDWLAAALGPTEAASLAPHLARREYLAGAYLCRQGEPTETLLFVESGRLAVLLEAPGEKPRKVRSFTAHTIVGEIGFFAQTPRTASLLVEENAVVWSLDRGTFETLRQRDSDSAASLYAYVIRILAERLAFASRQAAAAIR
jgi:CRP-like cAMP-binding protein